MSQENTSKKKKLVNVNLDEEFMVMLDKLALQDNRKRSDYVRLVLTKHILDNKDKIKG